MTTQPPSIALDPKPGRAEKLRGRIVGATGVLVVVPALLNAAYDIYAAALKLPRSENEKINVELFKKHFGTSPEKEFQLGVKNQFGTVDATFKIYREGDILVQYGERTQWFKFPRAEVASSLSLDWLPLSAANAAGTESKIIVEVKGNVVPSGVSSKVKLGDVSLKSGTITQAAAVTAAGTGVGNAASVRIQVIDIRSGRVIDSKVTEGSLGTIGAKQGVTTSIDLGTVVVK